MLVGFNTNISYKDRTYHVQTEDSGKSNPVIVTLLFSEGAIVASRKTGYEQFISAPDFREKVTKLMKIQHKVMIRELLSGKYTGESSGEAGKVHDNRPKGEAGEIREPGTPENTEAASARGLEPAGREDTLTEGTPSAEEEKGKKQITNSLDDILLNYIMKRTK